MPHLQKGVQHHTELAKILGISEELAASCLKQGHITVAVDAQQTFMRLRDLMQIFRRLNASPGKRLQA